MVPLAKYRCEVTLARLYLKERDQCDVLCNYYSYILRQLSWGRRQGGAIRTIIIHALLIPAVDGTLQVPTLFHSLSTNVFILWISVRILKVFARLFTLNAFSCRRRARAFGSWISFNTCVYKPEFFSRIIQRLDIFLSATPGQVWGAEQSIPY